VVTSFRPERISLPLVLRARSLVFGTLVIDVQRFSPARYPLPCNPNVTALTVRSFDNPLPHTLKRPPFTIYHSSRSMFSGRRFSTKSHSNVAARYSDRRYRRQTPKRFNGQTRRRRVLHVPSTCNDCNAFRNGNDFRRFIFLSFEIVPRTFSPLLTYRKG